RCRAAVAQVSARGDRVKRNTELVGDADDFAHLLRGIGRHGGRRHFLLGLPDERRVRVAIQRDVLVAREDPIGPDHRRKAGKGPLKIPLADARWYAHALVAPRISRARLARPEENGKPGRMNLSHGSRHYIAEGVPERTHMDNASRSNRPVTFAALLAAVLVAPIAAQQGDDDAIDGPKSCLNQTDIRRVTIL